MHYLKFSVSCVVIAETYRGSIRLALFPTKNALKKTEGKGLEKAIGAYPNAQSNKRQERLNSKFSKATPPKNTQQQFAMHRP